LSRRRTNSSIRAAFVCTDPGVPIFGSKGASVHAQGILSALIRVGVEVEVFASSIGTGRQANLHSLFVNELRDWPRRDVGGKKPVVEAANERLRALLVANGPYDIVYERYGLWSYAGMEYAEEEGAPGILEVNAPLIEEEERYRGPVNRRLAERIGRRAFRASGQVIAVSNGVARYLGRYPEAKGKVRVIHNGVDPSRFPEGLRASLPAPDGAFTLGFVGSLKAWHGLETLEEAYQLVHDKNSETRLLVVGDGPEKQRLIQGLAKRGLFESCEFTGAVDPAEVPRLIASMDVGLAPYTDDRDFYFSPLKVFEYMAAGVPPLVSRVGDLPSLIKDRVDGFLVPAGDPGALTSVVLELISDRELGRKVGSAARARVLRQHTWDSVLRRIIRIAGVKGTRNLKPQGVLVDYDSVQ